MQGDISPLAVGAMTNAWFSSTNKGLETPSSLLKQVTCVKIAPELSQAPLMINPSSASRDYYHRKRPFVHRF